MPWERDGNGDGLKLIGDPHYDVDQVRELIQELRRARNQPGTVCSMLDDVLFTSGAPRELIWRLSKWCDWDDHSKLVARSIAALLFHGNICRRLRDQNDNPIPDSATAEADYQTWIERVVQTGRNFPPNAVYADEVDPVEIYLEGAVHRVSVNAYERNPTARAKCLAHYGTACIICNFDFAKAYDGVGEGFIHVHHLQELSRIGREHEVDPIADLRPVCPNCHAVIHLNRQPFTVGEVKSMVARSREVTRPGRSIQVKN